MRRSLPTYLLSLLGLLIAGRAVAQGTLLSSAPEGEIVLENCARINDAGVQFGPAIYKEGLVYLTRPRRGAVDPQTKQTYYSLFNAPLLPDGSPGRGKRFSVELSSNYNEGPVSFSNEDRVIYFTRTQLNNGATVEDRNGRAQLGIFSAYRAEYDWAAILPMPFNGTEFSNQHPSVTADGRRIFFASNREGGFGGYDLYFSDFQDGHWGPAINLGPDINTEGNDAFPFIHPSGRLFFSSDGHGGRGGLDLFMIDLSRRRWGQLLNLPEPINGSGDDVDITLNEDATTGYLTSNRSGGMGRDDIYLIRLQNGLRSFEVAEGREGLVTVYDGATSRRLGGAEVWLTEVPVEEATGQPAGEVVHTRVTAYTDVGGQARVALYVGKTYELRATARGFQPATLRFKYAETGPSRPLKLTLRPGS